MNLPAAVSPRALRRPSISGMSARAAKLRGRRPSGRLLAAVLVVVALLVAGAYMLIRNSSLVAVEQVRVVGLSGYYDKTARRAVADEARTMTTLNFDEDRLRATASEFASVAAITVERDLPHGLTIHLTIRRPVAAAKVGARTLAVTESGLVLDGAEGLSMLPKIEVSGVVRDGHVRDPKALKALGLLGAAPDLLLRGIEKIDWGREGLSIILQKGVRLNFGNESAAAAKWKAASAVLASSAAAGAEYIDLRVPGRPAIGGLGPAPITPKPESLAPELPQETTAEPTSATTGATAATTAAP